MSDPQLHALLNQLVERVADALAPRIAHVLAAPAEVPATPSRRLLTLDELVALLPAGKKPATWKGWFYQRTRLGQVPGCHRLGGRLFFDPDQTLPWITGTAYEEPHRAGNTSVQDLDSSRGWSNDLRPMPDKQGI